MLCTCGIALVTIMDVNRKSCPKCWVIPVPVSKLTKQQRWRKAHPEQRREIHRLGQKRRREEARREREERIKSYEWREE